MVNEEVDGIDTFFPISLNSIKEKFIEIENIKLSEIANYTKWILK